MSFHVLIVNAGHNTALFIFLRRARLYKEACSKKMTAVWDIIPCNPQKLNDVSEWLNASIFRAIALMMEAVSASEMSMNFYENTRRIIAEDCQFHIR
jgi:hypothetical protein